MRRDYKFKHRKHIRYFIVGIILAALAFGSLGIRLGRPDTPEPVQYEPSNIYPDCNSGWMPKDYILETWKGGPLCPLDAEVETPGCERSNIYPERNPDRMSKDYIRETWKGGPPCPLDAANIRDNDTIRSKTDEE